MWSYTGFPRSTPPLLGGCWVRPDCQCSSRFALLGQMKMKVGILLHDGCADAFDVVVVRPVWGRRWLEPLFGGVLLVFLLLRSLVSLCLAMSSDFAGGTQVSWRRLGPA